MKFLFRWNQTVQKVLILLIGAYQKCISPLLGPRCRFYPTCSAYMVMSVEKHGLARGCWKGFKRICRCHPFHPGGVDYPS